MFYKSLPRKIILLVCLSFLCRAAWGIDFAVKDLTLTLMPEYNRTFQGNMAAGFTARFGLGEDVVLSGGLRYGYMGIGCSFPASKYSAALAALWRIPASLTMSLRLSYIHTSIPEFGSQTHTLFPGFFLDHGRFGLAVGISARWSLYRGEETLLEFLLTARLRYAFIDSESVKLSLSLANFDEFNIYNSDTVFLSLCCLVSAAPGFTIINEIQLYEQGSLSLTANFYGIQYRGGLRWSL